MTVASVLELVARMFTRAAEGLDLVLASPYVYGGAMPDVPDSPGGLLGADFLAVTQVLVYVGGILIPGLIAILLGVELMLNAVNVNLAAFWRYGSDVQDMAGQDILDSDAFAEHEGGFAAATQFYAFPRQHWIRISSTNGLERLHGEVKRRTRSIGAFPDRDSALRLVTAAALETAHVWADRRYLDMSLPKAEQLLVDGLVKYEAGDFIEAYRLLDEAFKVLGDDHLRASYRANLQG